MQQDNRKDVPSTPSLAKLLKTESANASRQQQQHFDGGGGCGGGGRGIRAGDTWGSISKMLHQRYNSGAAVEATGEKQGTDMNEIYF